MVAVFVDIPKTLVVQKVTPDGGISVLGTVTSSPAGINCFGGPECQAEFVNNAKVQLTASESDGWSFVRWHADSEACANSTNAVCDVPMTKDVNRVKAVFSPGPRTLTVQRVKDSNNNEAAPGGRIVSDPAGIDCGTGTDCEKAFEYGTNVAVKAKDEGDWYFVKWADDNPYCAGSTNRSCTVRMYNNQALKAEFEYAEYELVFLRTGFEVYAAYGTGGIPVWRTQPIGSGGWSADNFVEVSSHPNGSALDLSTTRFFNVALKLNGQIIPRIGFNGSFTDYPRAVYRTPNSYTNWKAPDGSAIPLDGPDVSYQGWEWPFIINDGINGRDVQFTFDVTFTKEFFRAVVGKSHTISYPYGICANLLEPHYEGTLTLTDTPSTTLPGWREGSWNIDGYGDYSTNWQPRTSGSTGAWIYYCPNGEEIIYDLTGQVWWYLGECGSSTNGISFVNYLPENMVPNPTVVAPTGPCGNAEDYYTPP